MRYQIWHVTADSQVEYAEPYDTKAEALEDANSLNGKPADGTLFVVKPVPPTADLQATAERLIELLDDEDATKDITGVPLSSLAHSALDSMARLISRLECDRGFNQSSLRGFEQGEPIDRPGRYDV